MKHTGRYFIGRKISKLRIFIGDNDILGSRNIRSYDVELSYFIAAVFVTEFQVVCD